MALEWWLWNGPQAGSSISGCRPRQPHAERVPSPGRAKRCTPAVPEIPAALEILFPALGEGGAAPGSRRVLSHVGAVPPPPHPIRAAGLATGFHAGRGEKLLSGGFVSKRERTNY